MSAITSSSRKQSCSQAGRRGPSFSVLAVGQPTHIFEGHLRQSENDLQFEQKLCILRKRKSARSRSARPSNNRNVSPRLSNVSGWPKVRRAAIATSGISLFLNAMAYTRNTSVRVDDFNLRTTSARIEDCTSSMSYFAEVASRVKMLSMERGISVVTGYNIEIRLFRTSAFSDRRTIGSSSGAASFGGWGRENTSLKRGEEVTSTDLWTRK